MFKWLGQQSGKKKQKTRQLWEREFNIVKEGLDEKQVVAFITNLIAEHKASQQASSDSLRSLFETAVTDAAQMAASIKTKAQAEAEDEAARIISQANQKVQEIKGRAEIAAQKEAEDILSVANRKAEITEVEAKQKALLFLLRAREEIEKGVRGEYKQIHSRLLSSLQNLVSEGQNIATELKGKRERLWESKNLELKEYEATLLSASGMTVPPPETLAPTEAEVEPDIAGKEKTEEPTQLQEEATEEKMEQPAQLVEEALEGRVEEPVQLEEEATEEKIEQPVQLVEEALEGRVEEPVQLEEEATVPEPVAVTTEELVGQHPLEERPSGEETDSARLKSVDSQALYTGEVELAIAMPVELKMVSKLYNYLQTISEIKILRTTGSWDRGTTITVVLDKPIPLISIISKIPDVEVTPELPQKDSVVEGTSRSLLRAGEKGVRRIKLTLKEVQPH